MARLDRRSFAFSVSQNEIKVENTNTDRISILVCSKDRRAELETLISSLRGMDTVYNKEIVVVEETDSPAAIDGVKYIPHPIKGRGIAMARNLALRYAEGKIVVFIDDDCGISEGWLDRLIEPMSKTSAVGLQGGVVLSEPANSVGWAESMLGFPGGGIRRIVASKGDWVETKEISTLNCAYRREVLEAVNGFDEELKLGSEDYVLAKKACRYGRCYFIPEAIVSHQARGNVKKIWAWFVRRGGAEVDVIRSGKQHDMDIRYIISSSILVKFLLIILGFVLFEPYGSYFVVACLLAYLFIQYCRSYRVWRITESPLKAFLLIPVVKIVMDLATDFGRLQRGVFA